PGRGAAGPGWRPSPASPPGGPAWAKWSPPRAPGPGPTTSPPPVGSIAPGRRLWTESGWNLHPATDIGIDSFQADRARDHVDKEKNALVEYLTSLTSP